VSQFSRESRLKKALAPVREGRYDFILLDCPPSLGLLTVNALTAAEELIVPIQCEYYALEGLGQLLRNVHLVQQNINPGLQLSGIVMTMFDPRTKLSEQVVEEVQRYFGELVYDVIIPRTVRLSEAPGFGQPITVYDPKSKGAESYRQLAREVALRPPPESPMPSYDELPTLVVPAAMPAETVPPIEDEAIEEMPTVHHVVEEVLEEVFTEGPAPVEAISTPPAEPVQALEPQAVAPEAVSAETEPEPTPEPATPRTKKQAPPASPPSEPESDEQIWEDDTGTEERVRPAQRDAAPGHPERRVVVIDEDADLDIKASQEPLVRRPQRSAPEPEPEEPASIGATLKDDEGRKRRWRLFRKGGE
jgi:hypothetical protein